MSVLTVRFHADALGKQTQFNVIHPNDGDGPFPALIQLHGYSDDSFSWLYNSRLVQHAGEFPMIVVLPDGGTSRYINLPNWDRFGLQRYEDLIVRDIPAVVRRTFNVRDGRWAIGGLSMGGSGALRLGMKHPDRFASIWAHSAGVSTLPDVFLAGLEDRADALLETHAARLLDRDDRPRLSFDCGVDDFLIEPNRALDRHLDEIGLAHAYYEHPGAHTWPYWDEHVREALAQHADVLGVSRRDET